MSLQSSDNILTVVNRRGEELLRDESLRLHRDTDKLFAWLMLLQWLGGVVTASVVSPRTWIGNTPYIHLHLVSSVLLGGAISSLPIYLAWKLPGRPFTRHVIAISQMLWSALLIHYSGGRIETHFHVFCSLAFLSFYRDWRVLVTATIVVAADHFLRGVWWPLSVFGVVLESPYRWIEHAAWVIVNDFFLMRSCLKGVAESRERCKRQAELESTNERVEAAVQQRTFELQKTNVQLNSEISERKHAQEQVRNREERIRSILSSTIDPLLTIDMRGIIQEASDSVMDVFLWSPKEIIGRNINVLIPEPHHSLHDSYLLSSHQQKESSAHSTLREINALRKDGSEIPCEVLIWRTNIPGSSEPLFSGIIRDVSKRLKREKKLKQAQANLLHAEKLASVGQLSAGIAHEINTPIQFIGDNLQACQEMFDDVTQLVCEYRSLLEQFQRHTEFASEITRLRELEKDVDMNYIIGDFPLALSQSMDGIERVRTIVQAMKEFSHVDKSDVKVLFDLNRALQSTITVAQGEWKSTASVKTEFANLPFIEGYPGELNQVFLNMLVNAVHAIQDKQESIAGTITVQTKMENKWAVVSISDTGCGMSVPLQRKIYDPFFTTKEVGRGSGQGLAISHNIIVERHKGEIEMESGEGKGTTFHIKLPIADTRKLTDRNQLVSSSV